MVHIRKIRNHLYPHSTHPRTFFLTFKDKTNSGRDNNANPLKYWLDFPVGGTDFTDIYILPISCYLLERFTLWPFSLDLFYISWYSFIWECKCQDQSKLGRGFLEPWWRAQEYEAKRKDLQNLIWVPNSTVNGSRVAQVWPPLGQRPFAFNPWFSWSPDTCSWGWTWEMTRTKRARLIQGFSNFRYLITLKNSTSDTWKREIRLPFQSTQ